MRWILSSARGQALESLRIDLPQFYAGWRNDESRNADFAAAGSLWRHLPAGALYAGGTGYHRRAARHAIMGITIEHDGAMQIARRSRGTPRIANRLLRRVRDYAEIQADGVDHTRGRG